MEDGNIIVKIVTAQVFVYMANVDADVKIVLKLVSVNIEDKSITVRYVTEGVYVNMGKENIDVTNVKRHLSIWEMKNTWRSTNCCQNTV